MLEFLTLKQDSFGLDISDQSLKIAQLKRRGRFFNLASWAEKDIEPGVIVQGEIKNEKALSEIIDTALKQIKGKKIRIKNVVCSLPEQEGFLQVIKMPRMAEEELKTAVFLEAENYIPFSTSEIYFDFQVLESGQKSDRLDVLIAAVPKKIADPYVFCLRKIGLFPTALEIESQAISRAVIKNNIFGGNALIIDFGKTSASFIIFSGNSLRFTTSLPISSDMLTEAISKTLKLEKKESENLKVLYGLSAIFDKRTISPSKKNIALEVSKSLVPILTDLSEQIKKYIDYYLSHNEEDGSKTKIIDKLLLCGKGANLKGIGEFLTASLGLNTEVANPWTNILPEPLRELPQLSLKDSLGYTTALGLALRGVREEP